MLRDLAPARCRFRSTRFHPRSTGRSEESPAAPCARTRNRCQCVYETLHEVTPLNAIQLALLGLLTLVIGVPAILLALLLPGKALKGKLFLVVSKTYVRIGLWFFRILLVGRGLTHIDSGKPYVFMANHASHADSPALAIVIPHPLHWVFKKELAKIPVFGWVLLACGQVMVDRSAPDKSKAALEEALSGLSGNNWVMISPESSRASPASAPESASLDFSGEPRSTMICPQASRAQPKTGIRASSFLKTQWSGWEMTRARAAESAWLAWLDMKTYGFPGSMLASPRPTTLTRKNHRAIRA